MPLIARIFVVLFAFAVACIAGATVLAFALVLRGWTELIDNPADQQYVALVVQYFTFVVAFSAAFISFYALLPAVLIIALAEGFRLRSILFYALAGAALSLGLSYGWDLRLLHGPDDNLGWRGAEIMAAVGIASGFVYWLVAGRNAGAWRRPTTVVATPSIRAPE